MSECAPVCRKLEGHTALITGGDSGIGRAVAYAFAKEGAIAYYGEETDATETEARVTELGAQCLLLRGDLKDPARQNAAWHRPFSGSVGWTSWSTTTPCSTSSGVFSTSRRASSPVSFRPTYFPIST